MATCQITNREIVFNLKLNQNEAVVLKVILDRIGGRPNSFRTVVDQINSVLDVSDESPEYLEVAETIGDKWDTIWFKDKNPKNGEADAF